MLSMTIMTAPLRTDRDGFKAIRTTGSSAAVPGATILRLFAPPSGTSATSMSGFNTLGFRVARTLSP
jgi:hypothetical protein